MRPANAALAALAFFFAASSFAQWGKKEETLGERMQRGIHLYEQGKDDDAMDIFMDVLVKGDPAEKALANDYLNRITRRMSEGEQRIAATPAPALPAGAVAPAPKAAPSPAVLPERTAAVEESRLESADRRELMRREIEAKIAAMRRKAVDGLKAFGAVRVLLGSSFPEGVGLPPAQLFGSEVRFKVPGAEEMLSPLTALIFTLGDAEATILPEGYLTNDSKILDMRRAMALRAYLVGRGLSPARVRLALVGETLSAPQGLAGYRGILVLFQYGRPPRLGAEGVVTEDAGPPVSIGVFPSEIRATKDEGAIIEFSVLEPPQGVASWRFEMLMPAVEGSEVVATLQEVVGDAPVVHQIYWNGRRNFFGEILPFGRYQAVLTARNLRGRETVARREALLEREEAAPKAAKVSKVEFSSKPSPVAEAEPAAKRTPTRKLRLAPDAAEAPAPAAKVPAAAPKLKVEKPKKAPAAEPVGVGGIVNFSVYFERDGVNIINEKVLQQVPANLSHYPLANLNLVGYAYKGEAEASSLAEKRVQVVADLLVQKYSVDRGKIVTHSQVVDDENTKVEIYISQSQ